MIDIRPAELPGDIAVARQLFREYAQYIDVDLCFQDFTEELASLPGRYAPPTGRLLLAWEGAQSVGCVAMRPVDAATCEMKRLYVRSALRGRHLGHRLAERICQEGRGAGYRRICLDTLPTMAAAMGLYVAMGFRPIEPYVFNPIAGAVFLGRDL